MKNIFHFLFYVDKKLKILNILTKKKVKIVVKLDP